MKIPKISYLLSLLLLLTLTGFAQPITPKAVLEALFTSDTIEEAWFSEPFLAAIPLAEIKTLVAQVTTELGEFTGVEGEVSPFTVSFANGQLSAEIALDGEGLIAGLALQPATPSVASLEAAIDQFAALPGDTSVLVLRNGEEVAALNADDSLAIGSAFKLAILSALQAQIDAGEHSWDEVVPLDPAWKSLPSGMLQAWPDDSPLTLHTLATLMISISDNTATDALVALVGREAIEAYTAGNLPLLTTQEAFKLKAVPNADLLARYEAGDESEKRAVVEALANVPLPALSDFPSRPTLDVEWYFTAYELCDLMAQVQDIDLMAVNPGAADPAAWARVAYKGGSELGVLNGTYALEAADGTVYCVVLTQNRPDAAIDEDRFVNLTRALFSTLVAPASATDGSDITATQTPTTTDTTTATEVITGTTIVTATTAPTATAPTTATSATTATTTVTTPLFFANVRLFDGETVITTTNVLVADGLITEIGATVEAPADAEIIDGEGKTLLPGLIDAHTHVFSPDVLHQALIFGVTTELDMFMDEQLAAALRQEQAATGAVHRADLFSSGTLATVAGGHGTQFGLEIPTLTGPDDAEAFIADRVAAGADYIKIVIEDGSELGLALPTLDQATVTALVEAAHAEDKLALVHIQTLAAAEEALAAGADGLAHGFVDAVPDDAFVAQAVENGLFVIPTLSVFQNIGDEPADLSVSEDPNLAPYLTDTDLQSLAAPYQGFAGLSLANSQESVRMLFEAGVPILAGTDAPNPGTAHGASLHRELVLLTNAGLSPLDVLRSATSVTADIFSLADRGRVAPGLRADLLLVNGDPTTAITATRDIVGIWKLGVPVDRTAYLTQLDAQRAATAAQQAAFEEGDVALISDFEAGDPTVNFGSEWTVTTDVGAGGSSTAAIEVVEAGADGSAFALAITGETTADLPYAWAGTVFMPGATPFAPFDLSSKPVLHFWAKGEGDSYRIQLFCSNLGQTPPEQAFEITSEWQAYSVDLATIGGCDTTGVQAIIFSAGPTAGPFTLHLDEVSLQSE